MSGKFTLKVTESQLTPGFRLNNKWRNASNFCREVEFQTMRERRPSTIEDPVTDYRDFDDFISAEDIPAGRFMIPYDGIPVDFLYSPMEGAQTTVVFFHGSTQKTVSLPMLSGERIMRGLPANRLAISDPSLTLDDSQELILSWFAGSARLPELNYFLDAVIRKVLKLARTSHLIFMGGSGGGFASLEMSRRFEGSLALAMNPQTTLSNYYKGLVRNYLDICWDKAESLTNLPAHVAYNLADVYPDTLTNTIAYVQNTRDAHHVPNHQIPFLEKVGEDPNVLMLMDAWGDPMGKGHVLPPHEVRQHLLHQLVNARGDWKRALLALGFEQNTTRESIEQAVRTANADLPTDHEVDDM